MRVAAGAEAASNAFWKSALAALTSGVSSTGAGPTRVLAGWIRSTEVATGRLVAATLNPRASAT